MDLAPSPVSRLPDELLIQILEICQQSADAILSLSHVSQRWRSIACDLPHLWAHIIIKRDTPQAQLSSYLDHSRSLGISLTFDCSLGGPERDIDDDEQDEEELLNPGGNLSEQDITSQLQVTLDNAERWQHLYFSRGQRRVDRVDRATVALLSKSLHSLRLPLLQTLWIDLPSHPDLRFTDMPNLKMIKSCNVIFLQRLPPSVCTSLTTMHLDRITYSAHSTLMDTALACLSLISLTLVDVQILMVTSHHISNSKLHHLRVLDIRRIGFVWLKEVENFLFDSLFSLAPAELDTLRVETWFNIVPLKLQERFPWLRCFELSASDVCTYDTINAITPKGDVPWPDLRVLAICVYPDNIGQMMLDRLHRGHPITELYTAGPIPLPDLPSTTVCTREPFLEDVWPPKQ